MIDGILSTSCLNDTSRMIFQNQKTTILINLGRNEEALELVEGILSIPSLNDTSRVIFQTKKQCILSELKRKNELPFEEQLNIQKLFQNNTSNSSMNELFTRIYCDDIGLDELVRTTLVSFDQILLSIVYYEKHNKKQGIQFINQRKQGFEEKQLKILNVLKERLSSKKTIFDCGLYGELLNCNIDLDLAMQIEKKKKESGISVKPIVVAETPTSIKKSSTKQATVKTQPKIVAIEGTRFMRNSSKSSKNIKPKKEEIMKKILIKDIFAYEIMRIGSQVYVEMQGQNEKRVKDATRAWDILETLSNKPITDSGALNKMIHLTYRLQYAPVYVQPVDEEKSAARIKQYK